MRIKRALSSFGRVILRLTFAVLFTALVSLALYVSLGRQLTPMISNYKTEIEERLSTQLGAEVSIESITGQWLGFSPAIDIRGLRIQPQLTRGVDDLPALTFDQVAVVTDIPESFRQKKLVLASTTIEQLNINVTQRPDGGWMLSGLSAGDTELPSLETVFRWLTGLSGIQLQDATLTMIPLHGNPLRLSELSLQFQSQADRHVLLISAFPDVALAPLSFRAEFFGTELSSLSGSFYLNAPPAEYAGILSALELSGLGADRIQLASLQLHGEFWVSITQGALDSLVWSGGGDTELQVLNSDESTVVDRVEVNDLQVDWLQLIAGDADSEWRLEIEGMEFAFDGGNWPKGGVTIDLKPGETMSIHADAVDAGLISRLLTALMPVGPLRTEVEAFSATGQLHNLAFTTTFVDSEPENAYLQSNVSRGAISSHRGVPAFSGVDGYVELEIDLRTGQIAGFAEIDTDATTMHIPGLFVQPWAFDRANGRVQVRVEQRDSLWLRLSSSVIEIESDMVTGRGQFALEVQTGNDRYINLELMVGALQADVSQKTQFLPTGAGAPRAAQGVLEWVDQAVQSGQGAGSGLIFRGMVHSGALPSERTLQMFFRVADGQLKFDPQWPALENVFGFVSVNDGEVDVLAEAGSSMGINFNETIATIRSNPGGGRWLTVAGTGRGSAQQGLDYLQQTPVTRDIGQYLGNWQAEGLTDFKLSLSVPLFIEDASPDVRLDMILTDNKLYIPEYSLVAEELSGALTYSAESGLQSTAMSASVLGYPVQLDISSTGSSSSAMSTRVFAAGRTDVQQLRDWEGFPAVILPVLANVSGEFDFNADLMIGQRNRLTIKSELEEVEFLYPAPFAKPRDVAQPMDLSVDFGDGSTTVSLLMSRMLQLDLSLARDGGQVSGLVYIGSPAEGMRVRRLNPQAPGVEVLGEIPFLDVAQWADVWQSMKGANQQQTPGAARAPLLPDLQLTSGVRVKELGAYGETFIDLDLSVSKSPVSWSIAAQGEAISGRLLIPGNPTEPWDLDLQYLHLQRTLSGELVEEDSEQSDESVEVVLDFDELPTVEYELPREDPLERLDPRTFPHMIVQVGELSLGTADFGSWRFVLTPDSAGALFSDLLLSVRGLQIGIAENPAEFRWIYDGRQHRSVLSGVIEAADLSPVLNNFGYAPSLESRTASFDARLDWDGSPAFFSALGLNGEIDLRIRDGRFRQRAGVANSALRLISVINFDAVIRRLRFSDDLARAGLSYDEITGRLKLQNGIVTIEERLQIIGSASLFQLAGSVNLAEETIDADLYVTLPVSDNIPWLSGFAAISNIINWQFAIGVFIFDRIFGDQVDSLTSAHYTLKGPWEGVEPRLYQVFSGSGS
jgi:uncharacterized protein (TIGR02099 family)